MGVWPFLLPNPSRRGFVFHGVRSLCCCLLVSLFQFCLAAMSLPFSPWGFIFSSQCWSPIFASVAPSLPCSDSRPFSRGRCCFLWLVVVWTSALFSMCSRHVPFLVAWSDGVALLSARVVARASQFYRHPVFQNQVFAFSALR